MAKNQQSKGKRRAGKWPRQRSRPLRRGKPMKRGPWQNARRKEWLEARRLRKRMRVSLGPWFPAFDYARFVREQDCALRGQPGHRCGSWPEAAHYVRRTRGGTWDEQVPLCRGAHQFLDRDCRNDAALFYQRTGINLVSIAATLVDRAIRTYGEPPP